MPTKTYDDTQITQDAAGNVVAGVSIQIWTAKTGGTRLTSTILDGNGGAVTDGTIISDAQGYHPFQETSGAYTTLWRQPLNSSGVAVGRRLPIDPLGGGGGGSVDTGTAYTWTAAQNFSAGLSVPNDTLTVSDTAGLQAQLDAAANPAQKADTANQADMLALTGTGAIWTYRTDTASVWMLLRGSDPSLLANWVNLGAGSAPSLANAPAGSVFIVVGDTSWPSAGARPSSRTDISYIWYGPDALGYPSGFMDGRDLRIRF